MGSTPQPTQASKSQSEGYWATVWRRLKKSSSGMVGLSIVIMLFFTAITAPLLANNKPIMAEYQGDTVFPAFTSYVDVWVPWEFMRESLRDFEMSDGYRPFNSYYPELENQTWKEARDSGELSADIWPLVEWDPNDFETGKKAKKIEDCQEAHLIDTGRTKKADCGPCPEELKDGESCTVTAGHLLGTDNQSRDILARLIHGTVVAMLVGVIAMSIAGSIGILLGLIAGFYGGWVDMVLSRITEVVMCFPRFFLIIAVIAFLEPSIVNIMIVIGVVGWTHIFRLVRGEVLRTRSLDYVAAARAMGAGPWRIMTRHVLPNSVSPVFVAVAFGIARAVLMESSLSFLGFGDTSVPSWGEIIMQGRSYILLGFDGPWHLTLLPGVAIFLTLTAFNLLGQGLRDAMDPKLRE
jgi:peptide/nickel transport system permease protein